VRDRERTGAHADEVARRLRDRGGGTGERVGARYARLRVHRDGDAVAAPLDAQDGGVAAGPDDGVGPDHLVVRAIDGAGGGDARGGEDLEHLEADLLTEGLAAPRLGRATRPL